MNLQRATIPRPARTLKWVYGVTTVPSRRDILLPRTLASLRNSGFDRPTLFVDGISHQQAAEWQYSFNLEVVNRYPRIRTVGNWWLAIVELYLRDPFADRYTIFQDDLITSKGLKEYLDKSVYPSKGYCNLFTFPENTCLIPKRSDGQRENGWFPSDQLGKGAVALVFDSQALLALLGSRSFIEKPRHRSRGHLNLDGAIVTALKKYGIREYTHYPSLVQHIGMESSMGSNPQPQSDCFWGEDYYLSSLLPAHLRSQC